MPAFLHHLEALQPGAWGEKGNALIRAAKAGLPVAPGFMLAPGEGEDTALTALEKLSENLGRRFGHLEQGFFLYVRLLPAQFKPGRIETAKYLGLHPANLPANASEILTRKAGVSLWSQHSALSAGTLPTLEDWLEDQGLEPFEIRPTRDQLIDYSAEIARDSGFELRHQPTEQLLVMIKALKKVEPDLPILLAAMSPLDINMSSLRARLVSRNPHTGAEGVVGQRLRTRVMGDNHSRVTGDMVLPRLETLHSGFRLAVDQAAHSLENSFQDIIEFDVSVDANEWHVLHIDQAHCSPDANLQLAVDLQARGHIDVPEALSRLSAAELEGLLHPTLDPAAEKPFLCDGFAAAPGAVSGKLVFDAAEALERAKKGEAIILAKTETQPDDVRAIMAVAGVLTIRGGMTSHAAVIARGLGKPAIVGARDLLIDSHRETMVAGSLTLSKNQPITLDGATGQVLFGAVPTHPPTVTPAFEQLMSWADSRARMSIRANAESVKELGDAMALGAKGVGLCRTEHMLFAPGRLAGLRKLILVEEDSARQDAVEELRTLQTHDLRALFEIANGRPMAVRLLDPPLHEFLPHNAREVNHLAKTTGLPKDLIIRRGRALREANPMLGHRGCRLGLTFPEIYDMQVRAILEAATIVSAHTGITAQPEIMIPLVSLASEAEHIRLRIEEISKEISSQSCLDLNSKIGAMIELPSACLMADRIAGIVDFFSFGTNDLTQTTFGISRDDAGKFLSDYERYGIINTDPFHTLDLFAVGELIEMACDRGRKANSNLIIGVCGEHGGDPASIAFFERLGLDYISCSPYRVPIARLAAAQSLSS